MIMNDLYNEDYIEKKILLKLEEINIKQRKLDLLEHTLQVMEDIKIEKQNIKIEKQRELDLLKDTLQVMKDIKIEKQKILEINKKVEQEDLCKNEDCVLNKDDEHDEKCSICPGYYKDDGLNDILFIQEEPNNKNASCDLCKKTENIVQMKGTGQYICQNACDEEEEDEEDEDEDEDEEEKEEDEEEKEEDEVVLEEDNKMENSDIPSQVIRAWSIAKDDFGHNLHPSDEEFEKITNISHVICETEPKFGDILDFTEYRHYSWMFVGKNGKLFDVSGNYDWHCYSDNIECGAVVPVEITKYLEDPWKKYSSIKCVQAYELLYNSKIVQSYKDVPKNCLYTYLVNEYEMWELYAYKQGEEILVER